MTKAEEMNLLVQISNLIQSAGEDSYIGPTFAGIVDICRSNIENDFLICPVAELEAAKEKAEKAKKLADMAFGEKDKLEDDFNLLASAYREAINAIRAAIYYVHTASSEAYDTLETLTVKASDEDICTAVRNRKKAQEAARQCSEVLNKSERKPLRYSIEEN